MADLKETDEPVEKASRLKGSRNFRDVRVSSAQRRNLALGKDPDGSKRSKSGKAYVEHGGRFAFPGRGQRFSLVRTGRAARVKKSDADPLSDLNAAIEKARGLGFGGSRNMLRHITRTGQGSRNHDNTTLARRLAYRSGELLRYKGDKNGHRDGGGLKMTGKRYRTSFGRKK